MSIPIDTITAAIKGLTVTGVTIRDTDGCMDAVTVRDLPLLSPRPFNFVTLNPVERDTYGASTSAKKTVTFSLAYRFFHSAIGQGRGEWEIFPLYLDKIFAIMDVLIATDLGGTVDMNLTGIPNLGVVVDDADNQFWGSDLDIVCTVFVN